MQKVYQSIKTNQAYLTDIVLHILIGVLIFLFKPFAKVYFFAALIYFFYRIIIVHKQLKVFEVLKACAYFVGAEVFFRMTKGSVSYEAGKYLVILFCILGMFYKSLSGRGYPYFIYLMLLVPSIFVASTTLSFDANFRTNIAFVLSGPVCLGITALFMYEKRITTSQMMEVLWYLGLPIITLSTYLYLYTPSIEETLRNTASNFEASGGFGPNQVSTVLGIGMFVMAIRLFMSSPTLFLKLVNVVLLMAISYRAIVTFSRGGVIAAVMTIIAFLVVYYLQVSQKRRNELMMMAVLLVFSMIATWMISSSQTSGYIDLRYANKDHLGRDKGDLSTGRGELFLKELEGFVENPFFGIGSSRAKDQRIEMEGQGVTSHNEVSRLLSEHGILGVVILLILLFKPLSIRSYNRQNIFFYAFLVFWFATINHSSMRIAAPAFVYGLALLNVTYDKAPLHRKSLKK